MPVIPIQRITSRTTNTVGAIDRATAVANLLGGAAPNVVNVGNAPAIWPELKKYDNDNNGSVGLDGVAFNAVPDPQFIWTQPTFVPGESHGFATQSVTIPLTVGVVNSFVITMAVFADNAHLAHIDAVNALSLALIPTTNLGVDLADGSLNIFSSLTTDTANPYNWQKVRFYSIPVTFGLVGAALSVKFVFSFEVVNYVNNGAINAAGLAFAADIYQSLI